MGGIVVIGAGQAGLSLCTRLRAEGYGGALTLVGAEPYPPYQRPPLSKAYLMGEMARERLFLRPEAWYAEQGIDLRLGAKAEALDLAARTVRVGGETLGYDRLAIATGLSARRLPAEAGGDLEGAHTVRGLADIDALAPALGAARRVLVVGGGYIGLEAASVARKLGAEVTVIEAGPRILGRVAAAPTADAMRAIHRDRGVEIREGARLDRLLGDAGRVAGAALEGGEEIAADLAIVGIGLDPRVDLAEAAGLDCAGGVAVDATGRTSDPHVWAAGDCAAFPLRGGRVRLESVQNAIDMGEAVARNMLGADAPYRPVPWFWSDQYEVKMQIAGLSAGHDRVVTRGALPSVSHWYYRGETLLAVDSIGDAKAYMVGKRLLEAGRSPDPAAVADPDTNLKTLLA